jgi:phage terminase large subunit
MPIKDSKVIKFKDDPNPDQVSHLAVQDKYKKRERVINQRPEGNHKALKNVSNEKGDILVDGAKERILNTREIDLVPDSVQYVNDIDNLLNLTDRKEKLILTPQQLYFFITKKKFAWFCAGVGGGKTWLGARWVYRRILDNPETLGLIGANTHDQLNQSTLKPFMEFLDSVGMPYVVNKQPPKEWGVARVFKEYDNIMVFPNGCHILLRSLDKPANLAGLTLGWFWIDETAFSSPKAFNVIIARLRCTKSKALMGRVTSTPNGQDWLYRTFKTNPKFYSIIFQSARENPHLPLDFIESLESTYDERLASQEIDGRIISVQFGRTYYKFSNMHNVRDKYVYDPRRPLLISWDFNEGALPLSMIISQEFFNPISGAAEIQAIDEIVEPYSDTERHCSIFLERYPNHPSTIEIYGDAYGGKTTSRSDYQMMVDELTREAYREEEIILCVADGNPQQKDRVASTNAMLRNKKKIRRAFVSPKCKKLIYDLSNVQSGSDSKIEKAKNPELTHPSDAWSYMLYKKFPVVRRKFVSHAINTQVMIGGR